MSFVVVVPELVAAAAWDVAGGGSGFAGARAGGAAQTRQLVAAAADEVSAVVAALFGTHGRQFQALGTQASVFHSRFVQTLTAAAGSFAEAEAFNVSPLQALVQDAQGLAVFSPVKAMTGRPM